MSNGNVCSQKRITARPLNRMRSHMRQMRNAQADTTSKQNESFSKLLLFPMFDAQNFLFSIQMLSNHDVDHILRIRTIIQFELFFICSKFAHAKRYIRACVCWLSQLSKSYVDLFEFAKLSNVLIEIRTRFLLH